MSQAKWQSDYRSGVGKLGYMWDGMQAWQARQALTRRVMGNVSLARVPSAVDFEALLAWRYEDGDQAKFEAFETNLDGKLNETRKVVGKGVLTGRRCLETAGVYFGEISVFGMIEKSSRLIFMAYTFNSRGLVATRQDICRTRCWA